MPNYNRALKEKIVDFILKSPDISGFLSGKLVRCDNKYVYVQLSHSIENKLSNGWNLKFYGNRLTFQVQHAALKYITLHKLFPRLIAQSRYSYDESKLYAATPCFNLKFRYSFVLQYFIELLICIDTIVGILYVFSRFVQF